MNFTIFLSSIKFTVENYNWGNATLNYKQQELKSSKVTTGNTHKHRGFYNKPTTKEQPQKCLPKKMFVGWKICATTWTCF